MNKNIIAIAGLAILSMVKPVFAQVTGGQHAFSFLELSQSPHIAALGGIIPAGSFEDVSLLSQSPALLNPKMHNRLSLNFNSYYADIGVANLQYAYHVPKLNTDFGLGIQYVNYGKFDATDIYGNLLGDVRAIDHSISLNASRTYLDNWRYGAALKFAHSTLADKKAIAGFVDVGVTYEDTAGLWSLGIVAKNMGVTLKKYDKNIANEPLPFDLQIGFSKGLKNLPFRIYFIGHHLYQWDIRYNDPAEKKNSNIFIDPNVQEKEKSHFADKLFRHINIGGELTIAKRLTISIGYNHLHRSELGIYQQQGMAGFSFGGAVNLNKFHVYYARSYHSTAGAFNQFGMEMRLNKLFGIGSKTKPWGWDKDYTTISDVN